MEFSAEFRAKFFQLLEARKSIRKYKPTEVPKDVLDRVQAYTQTAAYQKAMRKRAVWVEPRFAEVKVWHQGRRFRLRGLLKVNIEALLKATGQNIKQLLKARTPGKLLQPAMAALAPPCSFVILHRCFLSSALHSDFFITLVFLFDRNEMIVRSISSISCQNTKYTLKPYPT